MSAACLEDAVQRGLLGLSLTSCKFSREMRKISCSGNTIIWVNKIKIMWMTEERTSVLHETILRWSLSKEAGGQF